MARVQVRDALTFYSIDTQHQQQTAFENIVEKGELARKQWRNGLNQRPRKRPCKYIRNEVQI